MPDRAQTFEHRSTRTTGNDPAAGADPGGTRSTHPGQRDKTAPEATTPELKQHVSSADRNPNRESRLRARRDSPELPDEASAAPLGRVLSAAQFWDLMRRWSVPDDVALALIDYPGKLGKSGKRPRFRFTTRQQRITSFLPEIDAALAAAGQDPHWLHRRNREAPFGGRTPLAHMVEGGTQSLEDVLRVLHRAALRTAMTRK